MAEIPRSRGYARLADRRDYVWEPEYGGKQGWMEHELETGRNRVLKFQMGGEDWERPHEKMRVVHGLLLPPEPNLPFALNMCNSLAFDEVSGRLCLAFYDGGLHVLDFA